MTSARQILLLNSQLRPRLTILALRALLSLSATYKMSKHMRDRPLNLLLKSKQTRFQILSGILTVN